MTASLFHVYAFGLSSVEDTFLLVEEQHLAGLFPIWVVRVRHC